MKNILNVKDYTKTKQGTFTIEMSVFIKASAATIYEILTNKEGLEDFMDCEVEADIKVGGPIKFTWQKYVDANDLECSGINGGKFVDLIPNKLVSFTWGDINPERNFPWGSSLVEFKIEPEKDGTRVTLHHFGLPNDREANDHQGGWKHYLEQSPAKWEKKK